ncbi:MAG: hypothetical protein K6D97_08000 [Clostridia bacterium]|nr:hypothetical protein [Clostridia bacterium]
MVAVQKMKFGGKTYIVVDKFEYYDVKYLMLVEDISAALSDSNVFKKDQGITMIIDFVYKTEDGLYENVVDKSLYNELMAYADIRKESGQNKISNFYVESSYDSNSNDD